MGVVTCAGCSNLCNYLKSIEHLAICEQLLNIGVPDTYAVECMGVDPSLGIAIRYHDDREELDAWHFGWSWSLDKTDLSLLLGSVCNLSHNEFILSRYRNQTMGSR